ncbi:DUF898 family protein [Chthonobacter albigriseus]|uniref:DUF898 family protein n=1 Tax=Chthonobacter albigriseus TaxID=1683161 RepID=UPI0015EE8BB8|nr:DUF898 family protein [Chthonobacter albigriseus]
MDALASTQPATVRFDSLDGAFAKTAFRGSVITVLTLGLYRFWFVTNLRRLFWSRTVLDGSPFEYTGRGLELFLGFLVALVIVLPLYGLSFWWGANNPIEHPIAYVCFIGIYLFLVYDGLYRSYRYRFSRTRWRGIAFSLGGSAEVYAAWAVVFLVLNVVTLGWSIPYTIASQERRKIGNLSFGSLPVSTEIKGRMLLKPFAYAWLSTAAVTVSMCGFLLVTLLWAKEIVDEDQYFDQFLIYFQALPFVVLIGFVSYLFFDARRISICGSAISCGQSRVKLFFSVRSRILPIIGMGVALLAATGLTIFIFSVGARAFPLHGTTTYSVTSIGLMAANYGLWIIIFMFAKIWIWQRSIWGAIANGASVTNLDALGVAAAVAGPATSAANEGFGDILTTGIDVGF